MSGRSAERRLRKDTPGTERPATHNVVGAGCHPGKRERHSVRSRQRGSGYEQERLLIIRSLVDPVTGSMESRRATASSTHSAIDPSLGAGG